MRGINMKNIRVGLAFLIVSILMGCGSAPKKQEFTKGGIFVRTPETEHLLANLKKVSSRGFMFGHHDDTNYGIGWEGDEGRSDVKSVCGDYPAVISFDLGHIELGDTMSLDKVPFTKIRKEILNQYKRGGMSSLSWHLRNPLTGGDSWDVSDTTVVKSILPGGANHEKFTGWVSKVSAFINS
ncbi:beta-mannosidase, partial [Bacteroides cellulosilyticus]